jgi:aminopeptidase N
MGRVNEGRMIQRVHQLFVPVVFCLTALLTVTADDFSDLRCASWLAAFAPADSSEHRKYAPDREIDIQHLALDVTPDFKQRTVAGKMTLRFKPMAKPLQELRLDGVDLAVQSVTSTEKIHEYQITEKHVIVTFDKPIATDTEVSVTIVYSAQPTKGLYFRTPEMGYKEGETHLFTQGEANEARHWYPCYDSPNEKFTSEITCRVPEGMTVLSNGRLMSTQKDAATGLMAVRWWQDKPHANYLISLVAGYFKKVEDKYNIPLAFYTLPSAINEAMNSFRDTKEALAYFEQEIGVPYPWAKYDQVCVNDFVAGGMENTSITSLTDRTLFTAASENIRTSQGLMAHELAHQWFGDLVTCKDWSHLWLNEGFATYYAHLFDGHKNGRDALLYGLYQSGKGITDRTDDTRPMVYRGFDDPMEQFSYLAYPKGSWILHMLRSQLGDELYRRCIKTYLERHQFQNVVTEDLNSVLEELSGRSYDQFFDQWVYHAHHPELEINYGWDAKTKLAKISIAQIQKLSADVLLFKFPLTLRFKSKAGTTDRPITVKEKSEDFYFALADAPEIVRVDPQLTLLAKIKFNLPEPMLQAQLADADDMIGRLLAVEQMAGKKDRATVAKLKRALQGDSFHGVRIEAARALKSIHTEEAFAALADSLDQPDARVRLQLVSAVAGFYQESAYQAAQQTLKREKNPDIIAPAIRALGAYAKPEVRENLLHYLNTESYRNELADAAVSAIRAQDDPSYLGLLLDAVKQREAAFTSAGLARALDTLAYTARNEEKKDGVRELLAGFANHKKPAVQLAALNALGLLGDPKAIPLLDTFAGASKDSPERSAAEKAIAALRTARKPADELKELRNEVLELKKSGRELRKELDELKQKLDAAPRPPAPKDSKSKSKSSVPKAIQR